jgi:hypothetical protein
VSQLELELTISQEKHRTCQIQVQTHDQTILKLNAKLNTAEQKYVGCTEEVR